MKYLIVAISVLSMSQHALAKCDSRSESVKADLHWSDNSVTTGPGCLAAIEVRADPKGDAPAQAFLRREGATETQLPFNVFRDGTLYWEQTGKRVAFQDAYSYGVYRLWILDISSTPTGAPRSLLSDQALRKAVDSSLEPNQQIARFWPDFGMWLADSVLVTVRIQTLSGNTGPLTESCLAFLVSTSRKDQLTAVTHNDFEKKYKVSCQGNEK